METTGNNKRWVDISSLTSTCLIFPDIFPHSEWNPSRHSTRLFQSFCSVNSSSRRRAVTCRPPLSQAFLPLGRIEPKSFAHSIAAVHRRPSFVFVFFSFISSQPRETWLYMKSALPNIPGIDWWWSGCPLALCVKRLSLNWIHKLRVSLKPLNAAVEKKAALIFASFLISFCMFQRHQGPKGSRDCPSF